MESEKYNRSVTLLCPTCGGDQFEFDGQAGAIETARCADCGLELTKEDLIEENSEHVNEQVKEMGKEITSDLIKETRKAKKKAFRGSKHVRFK